MKREEVIAIENAHYMPVFNRNPLVLESGDGCYVYDMNGKKYLDFLAGIAVNALGHNHPAIVNAICKQAKKLIHTSNLYYTEVQSKLVKKLVEISNFDRVFLANSGAEANEGAIKLARKYGSGIAPGKTKIITANHSFHGRTLATLVATAQIKYQEGFSPLLAGFSYVNYGDIAALEAEISDDVCAVMLEAIQGEGGVNVPPDDYLQKVRELCDRHNALLIFDEVQTGLCRTGKWFGFEHSNVRPDIFTLAKGLGGGYPIGAFICTEKVAKAFKPGSHGSTFGGNPLGCAVAGAVLKVMEKENLSAHAENMGNYLKEALVELQTEFPEIITDIRGHGLLIGMELAKPGESLVAKCLEQGLIINCTAGNVIRFAPPLIVSKKEIDACILIVRSALRN